MVEHVQVPVGWVRRATAAVAVLNSGFVVAFIGAGTDARIEVMVWCFAGGAALTALPLAMPGWPGFRAACRLEAALVLVIGASFFFFGGFLLWTGPVPLLASATRKDTGPVGDPADSGRRGGAGEPVTGQ